MKDLPAFQLYEQTAASCSKLVTQEYSTSFSIGINTLDESLHAPIYGIYAMVRFADEIVDSFHGFEKECLLEKFKQDVYAAIANKISLNPVLHSFQKVVNTYHIPHELIEAFFKSMEMDLYQKTYVANDYQTYIHGSAEVVGLMCLKVFTEGDEKLYEELKEPAKSLGAAFQKVNFLRDMNSDYQERGRVYFPGVDFTHFCESSKQQIEKEIALDFELAYQGIIRLPVKARAGVLLAYKYYLKLFQKIRKLRVNQIKETRIRIPNFEKITILAQTYILLRFFIFLKPFRTY